MQSFNFSMREEKGYLMIRPLETRTRTISLIGLVESDWYTNFESIKSIGKIVRKQAFLYTTWIPDRVVSFSQMDN